MTANLLLLQQVRLQLAAKRGSWYGVVMPNASQPKTFILIMDDVPTPLRPAVESPYPTDDDVLRRMEKRIRELQSAH